MGSTSVKQPTTQVDVITVPLSNLFYEDSETGKETLAVFQSRLSLESNPQQVDIGRVQAISQSDPATWPPITVAEDEEGNLWVLDGAHRVVAARKIGLKELPAALEPWPGDGSDEAAYLRSLELNLRHGFPISVEDRKEWARRLKRAHPNFSESTIAGIVGLAKSTVHMALVQKSHGISGSATDESPEPLPPSPSLESISRSWARSFRRIWNARGLLMNRKPADVGRVFARELQKELREDELQAIFGILGEAVRVLKGSVYGHHER
jgi:hypothetical protein